MTAVTELAEGAMLAAPLFVGFALHGLCIRRGALRGLAVPIARDWFGANKTYRGVAPGAQAGGARGVAFHVLDQIDVVFGAWAVLAWLARPSAGRLAGSLGPMYVGHQLVSLLGHRLGMRKTAR